MGIFRCARADDHAIILVHEPETHTSQVIEIRNPDSSYNPFSSQKPALQVDDLFSVSISVSRQWPRTPVKVEPLANTVQHEAHLAEAASRVTGDTEEPATAESAPEVTEASDSPSSVPETL